MLHKPTTKIIPHGSSRCEKREQIPVALRPYGFSSKRAEHLENSVTQPFWTEDTQIRNTAPQLSVPAILEEALPGQKLIINDSLGG